MDNDYNEPFEYDDGLLALPTNPMEPCDSGLSSIASPALTEESQQETPKKIKEKKPKSESKKKATQKKSKPIQHRNPPVSCKYCDKEFPIQSKLKYVPNSYQIIPINISSVHLKYNHEPYVPCQTNTVHAPCPRLFPTKDDMFRHLWSKHKPFAEDPVNKVPDLKRDCPICGKSYSRGCNLKRHIEETHMGIKRGSRR